MTDKTSTMTTTVRKEKVYVLYGSQTGNSEEYANTFAEELPKKLSSSKLQEMTGTSQSIQLEPKCMQLDDFLELQKCDWTRLVIIFVSSYGVGQAPLGSYRFRDLCDAWKERKTPNALLKGVQFALCGLGDSSYTTFFQNPTSIYEGLEQVGAKRIGTIGKADASKSGDDAQAPVIARWKEALWQPLAEAVVEDPLSEETLKTMQQKTIELCCEINPDFVAPGAKPSATAAAAMSKSSSGSDVFPFTVVPVIMVIIAIVAIYYLK